MRERPVTASVTEADEGYAQLEQLIQSRVAAITGPVFNTTIDPDVLWRLYLENLPSARQQHYNCHSCRRFVQRYGDLVTVKSDGHAVSALWAEGVPDFFTDSVQAMRSAVEDGKVSGLFLWGEKEKVWGVPKTGEWTHLCGSPHARCHSHALQTPSQAAADRKQDYGILCHSLADYSIDVAAQALRVLDQDALYRSEKALAVAKWFHGLHTQLEGLKGRQRDNLLWLAVANAPTGFCHVRSTVISTLLDDIAAGMPFEVISRRWSEKLHPLQYQRPTAPPSDGQIEQAEKIVASLGLEKAFRRRYATLDDVLVKLWVPTPVQEEAPSGGLFGHLKQKQQKVQPLELPATAITWEKFQRTVLPTAKTMEVVLPPIGAFCGIVTAADPTAPAILQWDGLDGHPRNPVSWYFYSGGSTAHQWGLVSGTPTPVTAVFNFPHRWQEPTKFNHQGDGVVFALKDCREKPDNAASLCLFPEILKSDLHGVRKVIEAHSRKGKIEGAAEGTANGIALQKNIPKPITVRVHTAAGIANYKIDRWD